MATATSTWTRAHVLPLWIIATIAALYFFRAADQLLIPIVLAVLISYALEPVVAWLCRHRLPRAVGTSLVLLTLLALLGFAAFSLKDNVQQAIEALPRIANRAREIITSTLTGGAGGSLQQAAAELQGGSKSAAGALGDATGLGNLLQTMVTSVFSLAGHLVVIVFLVFFLLLSGHHVRKRLVEIAGPDEERRRTTARIVDEINAQVQRFLLVRLVTAVIVGVLTWLVLAWMGVENAAFWGALAGIFNSIPYFGPVIVSGGLFLVGLLQDGGLVPALQMSGAALAITSLEGWLITPPLLGKTERMSALAVFLGLLLWTWVWGAWGTLLAVPMLVVVKAVADHVDALKPIGRLMAP